MKLGKGSVVTLGDPVVDIVAHVASLEQLDMTPGGCLPIDQQDMRSLLAKLRLTEPASRVGGGSAANVAQGLAVLGGKGRSVSFAGMVGTDPAGREYEAEVEGHGIKSLLCRSPTGADTASCLCLVTPEGQRTMRTCLSAASELQDIGRLPDRWLEGCELLHCEGYCLYRPNLALGALQAAKSAGCLVSLDLASFELVRNCRKTLLLLLQSGALIDIVFCNEEEAAALAEVAGLLESGSESHSQKEALALAQDFLLQHCEVSVVTLGLKGCTAKRRDGQSAAAQASAVEVRDTVGAGDMFTAGFLHAFLAGASLQECAELGCAVGSASVQCAGAKLAGPAWEAARKALESNSNVFREQFD